MLRPEVHANILSLFADSDDEEMEATEATAHSMAPIPQYSTHSMNAISVPIPTPPMPVSSHEVDSCLSRSAPARFEMMESSSSGSVGRSRRSSGTTAAPSKYHFSLISDAIEQLKNLGLEEKANALDDSTGTVLNMMRFATKTVEDTLNVEELTAQLEKVVFEERNDLIARGRVDESDNLEMCRDVVVTLLEDAGKGKPTSSFGRDMTREERRQAANKKTISKVERLVERRKQYLEAAKKAAGTDGAGGVEKSKSSAAAVERNEFLANRMKEIMEARERRAKLYAEEEARNEQREKAAKLREVAEKLSAVEKKREEEEERHAQPPSISQFASLPSFEPPLATPLPVVPDLNISNRSVEVIGNGGVGFSSGFMPIPYPHRTLLGDHPDWNRNVQSSSAISSGDTPSVDDRVRAYGNYSFVSIVKAAPPKVIKSCIKQNKAGNKRSIGRRLTWATSDCFSARVYDEDDDKADMSMSVVDYASYKEFFPDGRGGVYAHSKTDDVNPEEKRSFQYFLLAPCRSYTTADFYLSLKYLGRTEIPQCDNNITVKNWLLVDSTFDVVNFDDCYRKNCPITVVSRARTTGLRLNMCLQAVDAVDPELYVGGLTVFVMLARDWALKMDSALDSFEKFVTALVDKLYEQFISWYEEQLDCDITPSEDNRNCRYPHYAEMPRIVFVNIPQDADPSLDRAFRDMNLCIMQLLKKFRNSKLVDRKYSYYVDKEILSIEFDLIDWRKYCRDRDATTAGDMLEILLDCLMLDYALLMKPANRDDPKTYFFIDQ